LAELRRILQFHLLRRCSSVEKFSFLNLVNMLPMVLLDKQPGRF
jgi:hypothetical protein